MGHLGYRNREPTQCYGFFGRHTTGAEEITTKLLERGANAAQFFGLFQVAKKQLPLSNKSRERWSGKGLEMLRLLVFTEASAYIGCYS